MAGHFVTCSRLRALGKYAIDLSGKKYFNFFLLRAILALTKNL